MFIADLVRDISVPVEVDFITVSSYGSGMTSSGNVKVLKDLDGDINGYDVLLVEDIVDTGKTLEAVMDILETRLPNSIIACFKFSIVDVLFWTSDSRSVILVSLLVILSLNPCVEGTVTGSLPSNIDILVTITSNWIKIDHKIKKGI